MAPFERSDKRHKNVTERQTTVKKTALKRFQLSIIYSRRWQWDAVSYALFAWEEDIANGQARHGV
jgi:hypothetical protein